MTEKKTPKMIPVDINGHIIPKMTEAQAERKKELNRIRILKTALKGETKNWSDEEKNIMVDWATQMNYDISQAEFKDIVFRFRELNRAYPSRLLRIIPSANGITRDLDVLCSYCARIHTFPVPVLERKVWKFIPPCWVKEELNLDITKDLIIIDDRKRKIKPWEYTVALKLEKNGYVTKGKTINEL